ncbi:hypothetical protein RSAG8_09192, partial [Rhizoctonia solani AG-8 WAC10335]
MPKPEIRPIPYGKKCFDPVLGIESGPRRSAGRCDLVAQLHLTCPMWPKAIKKSSRSTSLIVA